MSTSRSDASRTRNLSKQRCPSQWTNPAQMLGFDMEDGNADKETEVLIPNVFIVRELCSFAAVPSSPTLEHFVRYLSTWSGSDKLFMVIQYTIKLIVPLLNLRARLQHRAGLRKDSVSKSADAYLRLERVIADSRTLWRVWGILPTIQWLISLERSPQPTRKLLTIERLQGWSMLLYYPLEHIHYLASHVILPSLSSSSTPSGKRPSPTLDAIGMWSSRFWALYVILQLLHLHEDYTLLRKREHRLRKAKGTGLSVVEKEDLRQSWDAYWNEVLVNVGYLPLTVHWSLRKGLFKNEIWVGIFGLTASIATFRSGWKATALPSSKPTAASQGPSHPNEVTPDLGFDL